MNVTEAEYRRILRRQGAPAAPNGCAPVRSEQEEQETVILWAHAAVVQYPALRRLAAIPNGEKREKQVAARLKRAGTNAGIPDLVLPVPRGGYHGLWIELKTATGRVRPEQEEWLAFLNAVGYRAVVCRGADDAIRTLETYLQG